jgi:dTMP kinase
VAFSAAFLLGTPHALCPSMAQNEHRPDSLMFSLQELTALEERRRADEAEQARKRAEEHAATEAALKAAHEAQKREQIRMQQLEAEEAERRRLDAEEVRKARAAAEARAILEDAEARRRALLTRELQMLPPPPVSRGPASTHIAIVAVLLMVLTAVGALLSTSTAHEERNAARQEAAEAKAEAAAASARARQAASSEAEAEDRFEQVMQQCRAPVAAEPSAKPVRQGRSPVKRASAGGACDPNDPMCGSL